MVVKLKENFSANLCQEEDPHFEGMGVIVANDDELQLDQMSWTKEGLKKLKKNLKINFSQRTLNVFFFNLQTLLFVFF